MTKFIQCLVFVAAGILLATGYQMTQGAAVYPGPSSVVRSGTTPWPDVEGALFLDTDASANGILKCFANGDWRNVIDLP